jgi:hypothetical protein
MRLVENKNKFIKIQLVIFVASIVSILFFDTSLFPVLINLTIFGMLCLGLFFNEWLHFKNEMFPQRIIIYGSLFFTLIAVILGVGKFSEFDDNSNFVYNLFKLMYFISPILFLLSTALCISRSRPSFSEGKIYPVILTGVILFVGFLLQ